MNNAELFASRKQILEAMQGCCAAGVTNNQFVVDATMLAAQNVVNNFFNNMIKPTLNDVIQDGRQSAQYSN